MFIHASLNTPKFQTNKKLQLLKKRYITVSQFMSLLQPADPYILIGSTLVDKDKQNQFIKEWKNHKHNFSNIEQQEKINSTQIIENINIIRDNFFEINELIDEFLAKLQDSACKDCTKNRYLILIASKIKELYKDGREYSQADYVFIQKILKKYFPFEQSDGQIDLEVTNYFDNTWIEPDLLINIGYDLIEGLTHCFECTKKHLIRSKTLYNELILGYPMYKQMVFDEITLANKTVEECYILYWDSIGQIDMASCELAGQIIDLPKTYREEIIQLANEIRLQRIKYQQNILDIPNWDSLLIKVQKLQNKIKQMDLKK